MDPFLRKLGIKTPNKKGQIVPPGHILMAERLRGMPIAQLLAAVSSVTLSQELNSCGIDFCPDGGTAVIYFSQESLPHWEEQKEKILKLRKAYPVRGIIIADRLPSIQVHYSRLQQLVVGDLSMELIPVLDCSEVPLILTSLVCSFLSCSYYGILSFFCFLLL
ncbi:hypothetical protein QYM36_003021 [Artemia franciscana]|uniref:Fanconi anemia core complex-associated protein 24 pseudonuclease domain-containing protein n=1 Tax=Artemia franciscana TaxID=6661 RepID=A0AA88I2F3_ARTSF|nr:hypothetical protein QYM36_003021 [Artemia franciscana]